MNSPTLYKEIEDRQQTMLAFESSYYPHNKLYPQHKVVWSQQQILYKQEVLNRCNEEMTTLRLLPPDQDESGKAFGIHWLYNNIPTETEWVRWGPEKILVVEFRISPLIKTSGGRIALISMKFGAGKYMAVVNKDGW